MSSKLDNLKGQMGAAVKRFQDVMRQGKNEYIRDSAIQRFEFTFELAWKTMKAYLEEKGINEYSPRDVIRSSFQVGLIENDPKWLEMIITRNLTSHMYNEAMAEKVYASLSVYLPLFEKLVKNLP
jgi:nucleotidyltransferase substrate binding protein (TIGR01987 family)